MQRKKKDQNKLGNFVSSTKTTQMSYPKYTKTYAHIQNCKSEFKTFLNDKAKFKKKKNTQKYY